MRGTYLANLRVSGLSVYGSGVVGFPAAYYLATKHGLSFKGSLYTRAPFALGSQTYRNTSPKPLNPLNLKYMGVSENREP